MVDLSIYILAVFNTLFLHIERICAWMFVCVTVCVSLCSPTENLLARAVAASLLLHSLNRGLKQTLAFQMFYFSTYSLPFG